MLQIRNWIACFLLIMGSCITLNAQSVQYSHPLKDIFDKGMQALRQGDTLTAYQHIQSAYTFEEKKDVFYLSLFYGFCFFVCIGVCLICFLARFRDAFH